MYAAEKRDHPQVGAPQGTAAEDSEPQQRVLGVALDQHKGSGQSRGDEEAADRTHRRPTGFRRADHSEDQQHRGGDPENRAGYVVAATVLGGPCGPWDQPVRGDQCRDRDRERQQESPAPADLRHQPGEDQPERVTARAEHPEDAQRPVARVALRERGGHDGERGRRGERGRHALDEAGGDEQSAVVDEAAEQRGDRKNGERDQQDPAAAEQVGRATAEQQQAAITEHVSAHHPLQRGGGHAEVGADGRQRDADHGDIESVQGNDDADDQQDAPQTCVPPLGYRWYGPSYLGRTGVE